MTPGGADGKVLILQSCTLPFGLVAEVLLPARTSELHQIHRSDGPMLPFVVDRHGIEQRSFAALGTEDWPHGLMRCANSLRTIRTAMPERRRRWPQMCARSTPVSLLLHAIAHAHPGPLQP
jgi:hypothetical protein